MAKKSTSTLASAVTDFTQKLHILTKHFTSNIKTVCNLRIVRMFFVLITVLKVLSDAKYVELLQTHRNTPLLDSVLTSRILADSNLGQLYKLKENGTLILWLHFDVYY